MTQIPSPAAASDPVAPADPISAAPGDPAAAEAVAGLLLALESAPRAAHSLHTLALRGAGRGFAEGRVVVDLDGGRWTFDPAAARLAAAALRADDAFAGQGAFAAALEAAAVDAEALAGLLGPVRSAA